MIAVANHEGGYSYEQQEDLEAIAPAITQALQRKRSEEALKLSNIYNRSLIEASLDPLVTIGRDGKITDVSGATELVTGYSRNDLIGTDFSDYFTEPEEARKGYQQVFMSLCSPRIDLSKAFIQIMGSRVIVGFVPVLKRTNLDYLCINFRDI